MTNLAIRSEALKYLFGKDPALPIVKAKLELGATPIDKIYREYEGLMQMRLHQDPRFIDLEIKEIFNLYIKQRGGEGV